MSECVICGKETVARGWCRLHYERWKRTGDPNLVRRQAAKDAKGQPLICYVADCGASVRNKGLCANHYARLLRHGTTNYVGKTNEGASKHPLYSTFSGMRKLRWYAPEWADFWRFAADIGERPHYMARLGPIDKTKPLGPGNWQWSKPPRKPKDGTWKREASKVNAAKNRRRSRETMLRFRFGIGLAEYEALLTAQGGVCAICGTQPNKALAVDHCHRSGRIRGLLCGICNTALGGFKDDQALLTKAIEYLAGARKASE